MATKKSTADDWNKALSTWTKTTPTKQEPKKKTTTVSTSDRVRDTQLGKTQTVAPRPVSTSDRLRSGSSTPAVQTVKEKPKKKKKDSFSEALDTWNTKVVEPARQAQAPARVQYQAPKQQFDYGIDRVDTGVQPIQQSGYGPDALDPGFNPSMYKPPTQGANTVTSPIGPQWGNPGANQPQTKPADPWAQRMDQVKRAWSPGPTDLPGRVGAALEGADRFWGETFPDWYAKTPGAQYAADNEEWRQTNGPSNRNAIDKPSWDRTRDTLAWLNEQAFTVPEKAVETTQIPGSRYLADAITGQQGGDISLGQFLPAVGEAINRTWNATSLNRGKREGEGYIPAETQVQPLITAWNVFTNALNESRQARDTIEQMEGDGKDIGLVYLSSGGNRAVTAATNIVNQDKNVADLYAKAEQAQQQAEALEAEGRFDEAAQLRLQSSQASKDAFELKNKTKTEIADMEMNPWAEIITGILLDPTNALDFGASVQTMKKAATARAFNVSPTQADNILTGITKEAPKVMTWGEWLYEPLTDGTRFADDLIGPDVAKWANYINPAKLFERTGDTKAHLATDTLYRAAVQLFTDVTDKETARQILTAWTKDPAQLVRGLQTKNGLYQVGGGILANPYVVPYYPLLTKMSDQIVNLSSLVGEGGFNPIEVLAELNDVLYKGARGGMGLTAMAALPAGTISTRLVKTGANTAVLEYVGKSNKVISRSAEMITQDAQALQKTIRKAAQAAGPGSSNLLMSAWGMQKAILSDMYLGMQPGYWLKNALSATTHLMADNNMTLLPTKQIVGDFDRWYGGAPTTRTLSAQAATIGGAVADAMAGGQHWTQRIFWKNNPFSKMMNKLYSIPFGATDIAGRIPFGEQNFALRGTYVPIKRYITEGWDNVSRLFAQTLEANGVDPALAATLRGVVRDAGVNGNKQRIAQEAKKAIAAATVRQSLSELGVPDELLSAKSWADLQDIFNTYTPAEIEQAADAVKNIFRSEFKQPAEILSVAAPQPSRSIYSASDTVRDNAAMIDETVEAAKRAGDNPDMVRQSSEQLADQVAKAETTLWEKLRNDVAGSEDPRALNVALDLLGKWYDWRMMARKRVDDLSKLAIREDTTQAWQAKWKGTQAIYGEFVPWFEQAVETARHGILTGKAEGYDWFKAIQRYADYDDFAVQAERRAGGDLAGPASELYSTVIAANREFLDSTVVELFSAFKRYASQDSLDILASGLRTVEEMGAHTAQYVAKQRELLAVKKISKKRFYNLRNAAWTQFFDNAAIYNKVQQRLIVARGVAENVASKLKWVDDVAGGEFQLIGRGADGMWEARHTGDNVIHRFADPEDTRSAMPQVPANIIEDFNRAIGNIEGTVDEVIQEIAPTPVVQADDLAGYYSRPKPKPAEALPANTNKAINNYLAQNAAANPYPPEAEKVLASPVPTDLDELRKQVAATGTVTPEAAAAIVSGGMETRAQIRAEWDRVAKGEGGYLTIDRAIQSYTRNGVVSVPENKFEDLYGTTIAGQRIDNQADVDRLLQQYYDIGQQRLQRKVAAPANDLNALRQAAKDAGIPTITDAGRPMDGRLVNTINKDLGLKLRGLRDLTPEQYTAAMEALARRAKPVADAVPPIIDDGMRELDFTIPGLDLSAVAKRLGVDPYTLTKGLPGLDFFGMGQGGNLYEWIKGLNSKVEKLAGDKAPEMGELAAHTIRTLNDAENKILSNLEAILAGKPNTMTPAQQIRAMDELNNILPQFDNILAGAAKVGEDAANFTMLNYNDRRNIDALWGFLSPYHYYFSRTPLNWVKRIAQKPAILSQWYRSKRAIDAENEQQNLPEHLRGTVPNPFGIGPDRLSNPLTWLIPISMVMGNDFVDPNEARTEFERWYMYQQKYLPGLAPVVQFGVAAYLDETAPLPNGQSRVQQIQLGDFVPLYRLGGYGYQAMTGNLGPQNAAGFGDEYDYGRAGKQVALQEVRGDIKPGQGAWGIDVGYQNQTGAKPLPEQPAGAPQVWQAGAQRSGLERFVNRLLSFGLGVPGYYYSDAERQMRDMKENRVGLGYSADNPYGSKAAVNEYTGQDGDIYDASFNYSALYPGGENRKRPGVAAATNDYWNKVNPVYDQMNQAAELFLIENPNASSKELDEVKKPYYDKIKAIKEKFPSIKESKLKGRNIKYMSPKERAEYEIKGLLEYEPPNKPEYPGEKADPKVLQQYYKDKATWDAKRLMQIDRNLNQLYSGETATYPDPWLEIAQDLIGGKYSSELMRVNGLRNAEQVEKAWSQRQSFVEEVSDAEYRNRTKNVTSRLGEDGVAIYNEFFATPKGEERDAFADENPEVQISLFAGYHPQEFDTFVQKFGQEGLGIAYLAQKPEYPGENAGDAAMQQYYGQLDAYNKQYPQAEEINLWLKGRRFGPDAPNDDYGRAYNEAIGIFGPDIFEVINSFPSGGTKAQIGAWYRSNGNKAELRSAYFAWRREHGETDALANGDWPDPIYPGNEGAGQGYTGPRPVGMDYVPVGENRWWETPQQPNRWATTDWATLAGQQADNPWTQRANELNASLLGEQPIPSEMAGMLDEEGNPIAANSYSPSSMSAEDYVRAANEGKSGRGDGYGYGDGYSRRYYGRRGYSRRYYGGGGGGGNYYAPQVEGRGLSEWLNVDPQRVGYQAPNQVRVNVPDIGPEAIRAWRPLSWK